MRGVTVMRLAALAAMIGAGPAAAQQSASFQLEGTTFNQGGRPIGGNVAASASLQITLDAVGDAVPMLDISSASFGLSIGIAGTFAPPAEVEGVEFGTGRVAPGTLIWPPIPSADRYNLYRGGTATLPGTFGSCIASDLAFAFYTDATDPASRTANFYLVTGENRLGEQGTKGFRSNGASRPSSPPCP